MIKNFKIFEKIDDDWNEYEPDEDSPQVGAW